MKFSILRNGLKILILNLENTEVGGDQGGTSSLNIRTGDNLEGGGKGAQRKTALVD